MAPLPLAEDTGQALSAMARRVASSVAVWATPAVLGPAIRGSILSTISDKQLRTLATKLNLPRKLVNGRLHLETQAMVAAILALVSDAEAYGARGKNLRSRKQVIYEESALDSYVESLLGQPMTSTSTCEDYVESLLSPPMTSTSKEAPPPPRPSTSVASSSRGPAAAGRAPPRKEVAGRRLAAAQDPATEHDRLRAAKLARAISRRTAGG